VTADEANELVHDLERIGVRVLRIEPRPDHPGEWRIRAWCDKPAHEYLIANAVLFRQTVRDGFSSVLPRGALD
jgi:hypothetical protein